MNHVQDVVNKNRRNLFKFVLLAGGVFTIGKIFGSFTDMFSDKVVNSADFQSFKFIETKKEVAIYSKDGGKDDEPLLVFEK